MIEAHIIAGFIIRITTHKQFRTKEMDNEWVQLCNARPTIKMNYFVSSGKTLLQLSHKAPPIRITREIDSLNHSQP